MIQNFPHGFDAVDDTHTTMGLALDALDKALEQIELASRKLSSLRGMDEDRIATCTDAAKMTVCLFRDLVADDVRALEDALRGYREDFRPVRVMTYANPTPGC